MKIVLPALLLMLFVSCTKESVKSPKSVNQAIIANTAVTYKDNNISVVNFKAKPNDQRIEVTFTTLYEKNIVKLEILRGLTANNLCSIYKKEIEDNSSSSVEYNTSDVNENKASEIFYMIKYTLANGDWGYTPVFKLNM